MPKSKRGPYLRNKPKKRPEAPRTHLIREWREWAEMTQEELAGASGLSVGSISAYELGTNDPSMDAAKKIADAIGIPKGMLLDVNPLEDPPLWAGFLRASSTQRREIGRIIGALVGQPTKPKPK
jgi:transcriptional regulator with XRE-family HTH domain